MPFVSRDDSWGTSHIYGFNLVGLIERSSGFSEILVVAFRFLLVPMLIVSIGKVMLTQKLQERFKVQLNVLNLLISLASLGYGFAVSQVLEVVEMGWGSSTLEFSIGYGSITAMTIASIIGALYMFIFIFSCFEKKNKQEVSEI